MQAGADWASGEHRMQGGMTHLAAGSLVACANEQPVIRSGVGKSSGRKGKRPDPPRRKMLGVPDYGEPIALRRQNRMPLRAAERRGIFPIGGMVAFISGDPALEIDDRLSQSADPSTSLRETGLIMRWQAIGTPA